MTSLNWGKSNGYTVKDKAKDVALTTLVRLGLLAGVVVALLYTPSPGSETRHQLGVW